MCSNPRQRIAEIGQAIDDLAAEALAAYSPASRLAPVQAVAGDPGVTGGQATAGGGQATACGGQATAGGGDPAAGPAGTSAITDADLVVIRLARLWALLAELDPEVARRLPTYEA